MENWKLSTSGVYPSKELQRTQEMEIFTPNTATVLVINNTNTALMELSVTLLRTPVSLIREEVSKLLAANQMHHKLGILKLKEPGLPLELLLDKTFTLSRVKKEDVSWLMETNLALEISAWDLAVAKIVTCISITMVRCSLRVQWPMRKQDNVSRWTLETTCLIPLLFLLTMKVAKVRTLLNYGKPMKMVPSLILTHPGVLSLRRNLETVSLLHIHALVLLTSSGSCTILALETYMFGRTKPPRNASNFQVMEILSLTNATKILSSNLLCTSLALALGLLHKVLGSTVIAMNQAPSLCLPSKQSYTKPVFLNTSNKALPLPWQSLSSSMASKLPLKLALLLLINSGWLCQWLPPSTSSVNITQVPVLLSLQVASGKLW